MTEHEKLETKEFKIELGLHDNIAEEDYHKSPGISKHGLDKINQSPAHYKAGLDEDFSHLVVGSAFHTLVLEPDMFEEKFIISPHADYRKKIAQEWKQEQQNGGFRILSRDEYNHVLQMTAAIRQHKVASILCDPDMGKAELSGYWIDNNRNDWKRDDPTFRLCRFRADFWNQAHHTIVDLKSAVCAGYTDFSKAMHNYRYHVQDAFYSDGMRHCGNRVNAFVFVVIEKKPPYAIGVYELEPDDRQFARELYQRDLRVYDKCMKENHWPSYDSDVRMIQLPRYARNVAIY